MVNLNDLITAQTGRLLLLGNEAIVRGALEGGVKVATAYPGTPSSEIIDTFYKIARQTGVYAEYSTNEKVALEVAAGAAVSGLRSICSMKHVGLNVASDAFVTLAYTGVRGGLVVVTADDPSCWSSQNEQDNRYYARLANVPMFEPSNSQEAKEMTVSAFELSEHLELPILLRTTTRTNHTLSPVNLGPLKYGAAKGKFLKDAERFVMVPRNALKMHDVLLEKMKKALEISESSEYNSITRNGEVGLIRMVVNDAEVVVRQLESEGFMLAKSKKNVEVIAVLITEQHSLSEITRLLDDNEVNIDYAYSSSIHLNGKSGLILRVSDPDKSERILKENGIRTLTTTDLQ